MNDLVIDSIVFLLQFAGCKEELFRLLDGYIKNLGEKVLPYAVEIKVYTLVYQNYVDIHSIVVISVIVHDH